MSNSSIPGPDNILRVELENGIIVLVYENFAAQSVVIAGSLEAGSIYENPAKGGTASMAASALMRGTKNRSFDAIHSSLEDIGADLDVGAGTHTTGFSGKALAEDLPVLVELLADVLRYPVFPAQQVERLRGEILTGLQYRQQDTRFRAGRAFRENLYPESHPYHYSSRGTLETIPGITLEDINAFHRKHYGPQGMIVVIVGAVKAADAVEIVRGKLGDWQNPDQPAKAVLPEIQQVDETRQIAVNIPGKTQSDIVMGVLGPSRFEPDYRAATLVNSVLGQFGMMGRIGDEVREKQGLAYYAYSSLEGGLGPGSWSVSAGVNPSNVQQAIQSVVGEIRRIVTEEVTDDDINENKSYFTGHLPLQLESNEGIAASILNMESYGLGLDNLQRFTGEINALTKADLLKAIQRYWNPEAYIVAVAGPQ
ncbi:MAG: insulinase family protein [Chloroflexi bacterium]|nr:insulinase family protein [Chloroflexota bacterium]MCC6894785.1 insulinase family protein [Anaerolineae bacterium]